MGLQSMGSQRVGHDLVTGKKKTGVIIRGGFSFPAGNSGCSSYTAEQGAWAPVSTVTSAGTQWVGVPLQPQKGQ